MLVGYGHAAPRTLEGKYFCIGYALIGIPLNIVMFQSIGERFNIGITVVLKKFKQLLKLQKTNVTQTELTIVACILCMAVLMGGAAAFHYFEAWAILDAFYYCFITMSTIGFGDFVALQNTSMRALQKKPEYVAFSIFYILFGLTVFAAALNLMVLRLLTMNTEDERKDELQALAAARGAVKLDGDVITPGTQSTTVSSLGRDVEGVHIEADDSGHSHIYHPPCIKMKEPFTNSNGVINTHYSRGRESRNLATGLSWALPGTEMAEADNIQEHLCTSADSPPSNAPIHMLDQEEIAGLETVLASFPSKILQKRGSV